MHKRLPGDYIVTAALSSAARKQFEDNDVTDQYRGPGYRPGDYVRTADVDRPQLEAFAKALIDSGANPYEWSAFNGVARDFGCFGWEAENNKTYFGNTHNFARDVTEHVANPQETPSMNSPRNPFQKGDKVVPNGFRSREGNRLRYGMNPVMGRWEDNQTVLDVVSTDSVTVGAGTDNNVYHYHPSELRMASPKELDPIEVHQGDVVKTCNATLLVHSTASNEDNEIHCLDLASFTLGFVRKDAITQNLGKLDIDRLTATVTDTFSQDPETWKEGDRLRCDATGGSRYLTQGHEYILADVLDDGWLHIKTEDDGTHGQRHLSGTSWTKVGEAA